MLLLAFLATLAASSLLALFLFPHLIRYVGKRVGDQIRSKTESRRNLLLTRADAEEKDGIRPSETPGSRPQESPDRDWEGVIGFFHPFWCAHCILTHTPI